MFVYQDYYIEVVGSAIHWLLWGGTSKTAMGCCSCLQLSHPKPTLEALETRDNFEQLQHFMAILTVMAVGSLVKGSVMCTTLFFLCPYSLRRMLEIGAETL